MKCAVEIGSGGMINTRTFMKIGTGIQAILKLFIRNLRGCNAGIIDEELHNEMGSGAMIYIPSFIKICLAIQKLIGGYTYRHVASKVI
jgi:hypothetical protein